MIRSFTCVCALLAGASGLYLYSEKHRTTLLDQKISHIVADTQQIRERTAMLRAEWALLNQPDRLQQLSTRFLPQLTAMAPTQFVQMASLDARLPAVGPETPPHPIATPETAPALVGAKPGAPEAEPAPDAAGAAIARADQARPAAPAPPEAGGVQVASAQPLPAPRLAMTRVAQTKPKTPARRDVELADADDGSDVTQADATPRRAARAPVRAAHIAAPVRLASSGQTRPAISAAPSYSRPPVIAAAAWHPAHQSWPVARPATYSAPAAPSIGSALGSSLGSARSSLPAPVPVSDGN
ncbi:ABC transporter permease [Acetobacteraceae bacterium KSS8]|uniref:ABC transporter permease n=1 Tax=Endosaccharibacter trunci TaxID=2812733 RepID=A0ABT1W2V2_9PROT|nr:ABC transporter permease [Acetobacteraceae bacterium KSS8]